MLVSTPISKPKASGAVASECPTHCLAARGFSPPAFWVQIVPSVNYRSLRKSMRTATIEIGSPVDAFRASHSSRRGYRHAFRFCPVGRHSEVIVPSLADQALRRSAIRHQDRNAPYTCINRRPMETADPLIPKPMRQRDGRGRPWRSRRSVLNGILWVLRTGGPWAYLPDQYPSVPDLPQTLSVQTLSVMGSLRRDNKNHDCACLSTHCHRGN